MCMELTTNQKQSISSYARRNEEVFAYVHRTLQKPMSELLWVKTRMSDYCHPAYCCEVNKDKEDLVQFYFKGVANDDFGEIKTEDILFDRCV